MTFDELAAAHCTPRKGDKDRIGRADAEHLLALLDGWEFAPGDEAISRDFKFRNFHHTLGFINAVGYMANRENHHPDLEAGYGHCRVTWSTHDVGGLSMNDFICAARVNALMG